MLHQIIILESFVVYQRLHPQFAHPQTAILLDTIPLPLDALHSSLRAKNALQTAVLHIASKI